jgi:hypothetical protein
MIPVDPNNVFCDDAEEGAALGLLGLMTGISEEYWCAGWMSGLEYSLWEVAAGTGYGMGQITERQAALLRLLSEECDGWWYFHDSAGPTFIRRDNWREKMSSVTPTPPPQEPSNPTASPAEPLQGAHAPPTP